MNKVRLCVACCVVLAFSLIILTSFLLRSTPAGHYRPPSFSLPWQSVGGCGSGGGSTHPSHFYDNKLHPPLPLDTNYCFGAQVDYAQLSDQDLQRRRLSLALFGRFGRYASYVAIPFVIGERTLLPATAIAPTGHNTRGLGDIEAGFRYHTPHPLPPNITMPIELSLVFPTGQYALTSGPVFAEAILPADLQPGRGVWEVTLAMEPSISLGPLRPAFHGGISYPFNISFSGRNEYLGSWYAENKSYEDSSESDAKRRFYYRFKPYGENDIGDYYPPSLNFALAVSVSPSEWFEHHWRSELEFPLATTWLHSGDARAYDPYPNPNHRAWLLAVQYSLQITVAPVQSIFSISLPLYDTPSKSPSYSDNNLNTWNSPDWTEFLQSWSFGMQLRTTDGLVRKAGE